MMLSLFIFSQRRWKVQGLLVYYNKVRWSLDYYSMIERDKTPAGKAKHHSVKKCLFETRFWQSGFTEKASRKPSEILLEF